MSLTSGARLGPYEIKAPIGAGGMGEVFRARDTKLGREVAIKVLPAAFAQDHERVARFRREAQLLASLNHPNIAAIYGLEEAEGAVALVLELVEGEDLAQRLKRGAIPVDDAIAIARQIAEALEEAHERGIVHRDLKPANIKVTPDGKVKILDFGLARAFENEAGSSSGSGEISNSPTMSRHATEAGMIMGTAAYMSPEQARGKKVDKRADIWAFGVVLFEMLTGERLFAGETVSDTLAAVLRQDVDWTTLPHDTPSRIHRLLERCLDRDVKTRLRDIGEARVEIAKSAAGETDPAATAHSPASRPRERLWMGVAAAAAIAAIALALQFTTRPVEAKPVIRFSFDAPEGTGFATGPGFISISPDGQRIAFSTGEDPVTYRLWIRALGATTATEVPGVTGAWQVAWSPDGKSLTFTGSTRAGSRSLRRIDLAGGPVRVLSPEGVERPAWSATGVILFEGSDGRLYRIADTGGTATAVTELDASRQERNHAWPVFLSDGRRFIYAARSADATKSALFLASLDAPSRTHLVDADSTVDYMAGFLIYQREGTLVAQPFDEKAGRVTGDAAPIAERIEYNAANGRAGFAASRNGVIAFRRDPGLADGGRARLSWFDRAGRELGAVLTQRRNPSGALSPDGRKAVLAERSATSLNQDLWIVDLERSLPTRFTSTTEDESFPVWSPDGGTIVYAKREIASVYDLFRKAAGGTMAEELLLRSNENKYPTGFSPDGKLLLYSVSRPGLIDRLWALPMTGDGKPFEVFPGSTESSWRGQFSPDGHWILYETAQESNVFVQPFPPNGMRTQISTNGGLFPQWAKGGREIVYSTIDGRFMSVDATATGGTLHAGLPKELFTKLQSGRTRQFMVDSKGERFLLSVLPQGDSARSEPVNVIVNWQGLLEKK